MLFPTHLLSQSQMLSVEQEAQLKRYVHEYGGGCGGVGDGGGGVHQDAPQP